MTGTFRLLRAAGAGAALAALLAAPLGAGLAAGLHPDELAAATVSGAIAAADAVGWVLVPQALLAVAVFGMALERVALRATGLPARPSPRWLEPAVESALLLGMLGTLSGMVSGFAGADPRELEPGPLVHGLGVALRSSLVGFSIALVGVWVRTPTSRLGASDVRGAEAA